MLDFILMYISHFMGVFFFANDLLQIILDLFYTMEMMSIKRQSKVNFVLDLKMVVELQRQFGVSIMNLSQDLLTNL